MTISIEVESASGRGYERTISYFRDSENPLHYWALESYATTRGETFYTIRFDGWVEWEGTTRTGDGRAFVTRGASRGAIPAWLRSHLPAVLRDLAEGAVRRFEADPKPYWSH